MKLVATLAAGFAAAALSFPAAAQAASLDSGPGS